MPFFSLRPVSFLVFVLPDYYWFLKIYFIFVCWKTLGIHTQYKAFLSYFGARQHGKYIIFRKYLFSVFILSTFYFIFYNKMFLSINGQSINQSINQAWTWFAQWFVHPHTWTDYFLPKISNVKPIQWPNKRYILSTFEKIEMFAFLNALKSLWFNKLSNDTKFVKNLSDGFENRTFIKGVFLSVFYLYFTHYFGHYLRMNLTDKLLM